MLIFRNHVFEIGAQFHVLLHVFGEVVLCALHTFLSLEGNEGAHWSVEFVVVVVEVVVDLVINFL